MPAQDNERRYEEILRRIQARKTPAVTPEQTALAGALDSLNAMGFLDDLPRRKLAVSLYGPAAARGAGWAGAVAWYKPRGYYHYRTLTLLGIWALAEAEQIRIRLGTKALQFDAPVFNPESYYREIRQRFDLYYPDDGCPPPDALYSSLYDAARRLAIRDELQAALDGWTRQHLRHF